MRMRKAPASGGKVFFVEGEMNGTPLPYSVARLRQTGKPVPWLPIRKEKGQLRTHHPSLKPSFHVLARKLADVSQMGGVTAIADIFPS